MPHSRASLNWRQPLKPAARRQAQQARASSSWNVQLQQAVLQQLRLPMLRSAAFRT